MKSLMQKAAPPAIATMVGAGAAVFGTVEVVMASGILPVSLARLLGAAVPAGALVGLLAAFVLPRNWRWTRIVVTFVVAFGVACFMFKRVADQGLLLAERHAERIASLIERHSMNTHKWPADLSEVAGIESIPAPAGPWLSYPHVNPPYVAGFAVGYESNPPRVWVARRRYGAEYDLRTRKWVPLIGN
jgi:hypothetical protein